MLIILPFVTAQSSCFVSTNCTNATLIPNASITYSGLGFVSTHGHFSTTGVNFGFTDTYKLCCPTVVQIETTAPTAFRVSTINPPISNGSGHVQSNSYTDFIETVNLNAECNVKATCSTEEICLFKMSSDEGSHVMDCHNANHPAPNSYTLKMCCKLQEKCWDGIDNDLDGKIDCADSDCNDFSSSTFGNNPQICTNFVPFPPESSPYNTTRCIIGWDPILLKTIYNPDCVGQWPPPPPNDNAFYCVFGKYDDPVQEPTGVCCPVGTRPEEILGTWRCMPTAQCGLAPRVCKFDFDLSRPLTSPPDWYNSSYSGNPFDWCNTQVTDLYIPPGEWPDGTYSGSTGCCLIPKFGQINYWIDVGNVKIFG